MRATLQRVGNSRGIILSKPALAQLGIVDTVDVAVEDDRIVITKARAVREGWAQAAATVAAAGLSDEDREWLDAPLSADADAAIDW